MRVLRSNGENEARAYVEVELRPSCHDPAMEMERVQLVDPRETSTVQSGAPDMGAGPRNPQQSAWPPPAPPGIDLPDGLPATKAQRVFIDPELVARWHAEAKMQGPT